jgi:hypothetical protein
MLVSFVIGCKPKQNITNPQLDINSQIAVKGNWAIESVTYPGSEYIKVTSFDIADTKCFVGSTWRFISNNNKGEMALNNASCTAFTSPITWFINRDGDFVLKITNGAKSKTVTDGYILKVANQTENSFQLIDKVNVGGKMVDVVYNFKKI